MSGIEIIVPSTIEYDRRWSLKSAIDSVLSQESVDVSVLLVANGPHVNESVLADFYHQEGIRVLRQSQGSLPVALQNGRKAIRGDFFGFLDDDDLLLPGALKCRLEIMMSDNTADVVVTNGYRSLEGKKSPIYQVMSAFQDNPLAALVDVNWLASCGALYRSRTIGAEYWSPNIKYFEWTAVAFKLAHCGMVIRFIEDMTFVVRDTPGSLSKNPASAMTAPTVIETLLQYNLSQSLKQHYQEKLMGLRHTAARYALMSGRYGEAWRHHLGSMQTARGVLLHWRFTARLLGAGFVRTVGSLFKSESRK